MKFNLKKFHSLMTIITSMDSNHSAPKRQSRCKSFVKKLATFWKSRQNRNYCNESKRIQFFSITTASNVTTLLVTWQLIVHVFYSTCLPLLDMNPVAASSLMLASTNGTPVLPSKNHKLGMKSAYHLDSVSNRSLFVNYSPFQARKSCLSCFHLILLFWIPTVNIKFFILVNFFVSKKFKCLQ